MEKIMCPRPFKILAVMIVLSIWACASTHSLSPDRVQNLAFGSFGGFAGSYTEYTISAGGSVYRRSKFQGRKQEMGPLDVREVNQIIHLLGMLHSDGYAINDPGNQTYFIRINWKGMPQYELIWGGANVKEDPGLLILYNNLLKMTRDNYPVM